MKRKTIAVLICVGMLGLASVAQGQGTIPETDDSDAPQTDVATPEVDSQGEAPGLDLGLLNGCNLGNACIWAQTNYGNPKVTYGNNDCSNWCGPIVAGFPNGIASAVNAFTNRSFRIRVGVNGYVKCLPGAAPNLLNDGQGAYTYVRVGANPSGC